MKSLDQILRFEPWMSNSGNEPNIKVIIIHYYTSHGIKYDEAVKLMEEYVLKLNNYSESVK